VTRLLTAALAEGLSPRELVEAVEDGDMDVLLTVKAISIERATKVINYLRCHPSAILVSQEKGDALPVHGRR
jgi:hypothetical protein